MKFSQHSTSLWLALAAVLIAFVVNVSKPVHLDETNFLALLGGDFIGPHSIQLNWGGNREPAFDVLSNPPGIAWYLWPFRAAPVWALRLVMLPWALLTLLGVWRLSRQFGANAPRMTLLVSCFPLFSLAVGGLMPDMMLWALSLLGLAGVMEGKNTLRWAVVLGLASLTRYSGLCMLPLLVVILWSRGRQSELIKVLSIAVAPSMLLLCHDLWSYERWHFYSMIAFQGVSMDSTLLWTKLLAICGYIGSLCCWWFPLSRTTLLSAALLFVALSLSGLSVIGACAVSLGSVFLVSTVLRHREQPILLCWLLGGLIFLLSLRFAAARYWVPFIFPVLLGLDRAGLRGAIAVTSSALLSLLMIWDDRGLAQAHHDLAQRLSAAEPALFAGHWGWQYYAEQRGWTALENDQPVPAGTLIASVKHAWPQEPLHPCRTEEETYVSLYTGSGLRIHSLEAQANVHSQFISQGNQRPVAVFTAWGIGWDPWEELSIYRSCRAVQ